MSTFLTFATKGMNFTKDIVYLIARLPINIPSWIHMSDKKYPLLKPGPKFRNFLKKATLRIFVFSRSSGHWSNHFLSFNLMKSPLKLKIYPNLCQAIILNLITNHVMFK